MKKIYTLIIFLTLFIFTNSYSVEKKSGHTMIGSEGNVLYYSLKQKRYISCKAFVLEGGRLIVGGYTVIPNCDTGDLSLSNLEGVKTFDSSKYDKYIVDKNELEEFFNSSDTDVSNKKNSGDVKGKKLFCHWGKDSISGFGIEFNRKNKVLMKGIDDDEEKIIKINGQYNALSDKIIIKYKNWLDDSDEEIIIDRKTLKIRYASQSFCEPIKGSKFIDKKLQVTLDKFISEKSSENKF